MPGMPIAARAKTPTRLVALAVAALAAVTLSACDSSSGPASTDDDVRQVTVVGAGQVQGTPDLLTVNTSIEAIAPDVTAAMNQTSERQTAVINALAGSGIDRNDISTSQVSLQPQFPGGDSTTIMYRERSIASVTLPHRSGLAVRSVESRNTRSAYNRPTRRPMR